jgi:hypothetical protein
MQERPKPITEEEFRPLMERNWQPVELAYGALPTWMKAIPESQRIHVYGSGSPLGDYSEKYHGSAVGGMDVFRDSRSHPESAYGMDWNKDHYVIIRDTINNGALLMYLPLKDHEHWLKEIPDQLKNVEILSFDRKAPIDRSICLAAFVAERSVPQHVTQRISPDKPPKFVLIVPRFYRF